MPGRARGVLGAGDAAGVEAVRVVSQRELGMFAGEAAALLVVDGAPLSHPMIRLLGRGIPTVMISVAQANELAWGREVVVDGQTGRVDTPEAASAWPPWRAPEVPQTGGAVISADGRSVLLRASVADAEAAALARAAGAAAIGLVRSEYVAAGAVPPTADRLESLLDELCRAAGSLPVTVRLLDIAADKRPEWLDARAGMAGALGLQGPRLYDLSPVAEVVRAQVSALGRLSARHTLSVLVPFLTRPEEFRRWRLEIERVSPVPLKVGAMLETPAAVFALPEFARAADFLSIGCNDLMQCLFAADRDIPEVADQLDPHAPALFRVLRQAAQAAGAQCGEIQLCGLLPQLPGVLPVLLGLGYRVFSAEPRLIPYLAATVRGTDVGAAERLADDVCAAGDSEQVSALLGTVAGSPWAVGGLA